MRLYSDTRKEIFVLRDGYHVILDESFHEYVAFLADVMDAFVRTRSSKNVRSHPG